MVIPRPLGLERARYYDADQLRQVPHPERVTVILNPIARGLDRAWREVKRIAERSRWPEPDYVTTTIEEPGSTQATRAVEAGADLVIVAGGDGTVRAVADGMAGTGVPLGILPVGTGNIFARNLQLPAEAPRAARIALTGPVAELDLGEARFRIGDVWSVEHSFLVLAGLGHDAATVSSTREDLKRHLGWIAYAEAGLRHAGRRPTAMTLALDDNPPEEVEAWSILAGNCPTVRMGVHVFHDARLDDGILNPLVVSVRNPLGWLPVAAKGILAFPQQVAGLRYEQAERLRIRPGKPMPFQLDGEVFGPVDEVAITIRHRVLSVRVPGREVP